MPAKRMPVSLPGSPIENDGLRSASPRRSITDTRSDSEAISFSNASSSCDFAPSSTDATISIGLLTFSRYVFNWVLRLASSMAIRFRDDGCWVPGAAHVRIRHVRPGDARTAVKSGPCGAAPRGAAARGRETLDLADQVQRRGQRF